MNIFLLAASLRKNSYNKKLVALCANYLKKDHNISLMDINDFDVPSYNQDLEAKNSIPSNAVNFGSKIQESDKVIIAVPEYNYSIPGFFKNIIDWVSRIKTSPLKNAEILLISASPAMAGGNRGYWQSRIPLEGCGAFVYPGTFALSNCYKIMNENGELNDKNLLKQLHMLIDEFIDV